MKNDQSFQKKLLCENFRVRPSCVLKAIQRARCRLPRVRLMGRPDWRCSRPSRSNSHQPPWRSKINSTRTRSEHYVQVGINSLFDSFSIQFSKVIRISISWIRKAVLESIMISGGSGSLLSPPSDRQSPASGDPLSPAPPTCLPDTNLVRTEPNTFTHPLRPNNGSIGRSIPLRANYFQVQIPNGDLHHYDVDIKPDKCPRRVNREIVENMVENYRNAIFQVNLAFLFSFLF